MPYKYQIEKLKIPKELDRRIHLTDQDKLDILALYSSGHFGIREIARKYADKCTRRLIQFVIFPERRERARQGFLARRKDGRYKPTKEKWASIMREHRQYKQTIKDSLI